MRSSIASLACLSLLGGCISPLPSSLGDSLSGSGPVVRFDAYHQPFPDIPLPNDFATVYDASSPTHRRLNASILDGTTAWERATRAELDKLSGWGTLSAITVGFESPIDPEVIYARHIASNLDFSDDAVLVIDVTPGSPDYCQAVPLDLGQGNYPQVLADQQQFDSDPRATLQTAIFEETEEDVNGNGVFDPGEDTDSDGVFDHPNTRDGKPGSPRLEFYERETNTLIMKPMVPMREKTTYAVVLTKRLTAPGGAPIRSPFDGINDISQSRALAPLPSCLPQYGLAVDDVAFTWSFTTQDLSSDYQAVRDGLYGVGPLASVGSQFPAQITTLDDVRDAAAGVTNTKILPGDIFTPVMLELVGLTAATPSEVKIIGATMRAVDFVVGGVIDSPQFFARNDANGKPLPFYDQTWDLAAPPRSEGVPFWMFVPKNRKGPAPVAVFIHGLGGSKFDGAIFAGLMASYGIATLSFDAPSHGLALSAAEQQAAMIAFQNAGFSGLAKTVLRGRAVDRNNDGVADSGADYFTGYVFHTRDMVRQTMVDLMQIVRTLRAFDGKTTWAFDPAHKGAPGLAGDFDGDGVVDVGGTAPIQLLGGSLGGITTALASGLEPAIDATVAILPGGMLSEIGPRATLSPVRDGVMLRVLGPIFYGSGGKIMERINDAVNSDVTLAIADLPAVTPGDTVVLHDLSNATYRCGAVQPSGTFRVAASMDEGDALELRFYHGPLPTQPLEGCVEPTDAAPYADITALGQDVKLDGRTLAKGTPLTAFTDGFGERRSTPDLRRFLGLAQIALEPADPMNWAPYWDGTRTMSYGTGETVHTNVMLMPSNGDPVVVVDTGIALGRAAGFVSYDKIDPRWGVSANDELIKTWATEGTYRVGHYHDAQGQPVLMDVANSESIVPGADDGFGVPRLSPPMRLMRQNADQSYSGFIIPMLTPEGAHTFPVPDPTAGFDLGTYLLNIAGRYLQSSGYSFTYDKCQVTSSCPWPTFPLQ